MEPSRKEQIFIVTTVAVLLLGGVAFGVAQFFWMGAPAQLPASTVAINRSMSVSSSLSSSVANAAPVPAMDAAATERFMKVYRLDDNQAVKRIAPPFIAERDPYFRNLYASRGSRASSPPTMGSIVFRFTGGQMALSSMSTSQSRPLSSILSSIQIQPMQVEIPPEIMSSPLTGDWVVRPEATEEQKMQALGPIISAASGKKVHFNKQQVDRDAVTASGQFAFKPMDDAPDNTSVQFFIDKADFAAAAANGPVSNTRMPVSDMVRYMGTIANIQVTPDLQGDISNTTVPIRIYSQSLLALRQPGDHSEALKKFLDNIAQQTGLTFKTETKKIDAWALCRIEQCLLATEVASPGTICCGAFRKTSISRDEYHEGNHRFEHWYRDNQVYFITARCRDRMAAFASEQAKQIFWGRFELYTSKYGFVPWITTLLDNHYHTFGYLKVGENLGPMMRNIHGSVAKLVNDLLPTRLKPFWYDSGKQGYFDGCIRDVLQATRAYQYTLIQSVRHGIASDWRLYPHTHVNVEMDKAIKRAAELRAFMEGVPYARYERHMQRKAQRGR